VGREFELAQLLGLVTASAGGARAMLAVVEGEAGTGKTRMLDEGAVRSRLEGALAATVRAVPADRAEPGGGIIALARGLLDGRGLAAAAPGAIAAFAARIGEWQDRFPGVRRSPAGLQRRTARRSLCGRRPQPR
jgi:hypothetical protein